MNLKWHFLSMILLEGRISEIEIVLYILSKVVYYVCLVTRLLFLLDYWIIPIIQG